MLAEETGFDGLKVLRNFVSHDSRGIFVKTLNKGQFEQAGLHFEVQESYYSVSGKDVLRGMHFQLPPHAHQKLVYVTEGQILDVVVDLRATSATYQQIFSLTLEAHTQALFIPQGFAHGFLTLSPTATVIYSVATGYEPSADAGIRWDSLGFTWPVSQPVISERDRAFPTLADFASPFQNNI